MAMTMGPSSGDDDEMMSTINTTPLVDVMLVLLIIFLITIPVVIHTVPVSLPKETNQPTQTKPQNIVIAITRDGEFFWNSEAMADRASLLEHLKQAAQQVPQPEIHIRGDQDARYAAIGTVVTACQQAGLAKIAFITEPPPH